MKSYVRNAKRKKKRRFLAIIVILFASKQIKNSVCVKYIHENINSFHSLVKEMKSSLSSEYA